MSLYLCVSIKIKHYHKFKRISIIILRIPWGAIFRFRMILSCLCTKEAARTRVLSKTWLHAWSTNPNLDFIDTLFPRDPANFNDRERFLNIVDKTLQTYHKQRIPIHEFRLSLSLINEWTSIIDNWIGILLQNYVKELELQIFPANDQGTRYTLPQMVFTAKCLTALKLHQCKLKQHSSYDSIKLHSLQKLSLMWIDVDEQMFQSPIALSLKICVLSGAMGCQS
ncbi:unnamed protein product [Camellia sinensis]